MLLDRRLIKNFDFYLVLLLLALCGVGMLTLYSATHGMSDIPDPFYYLRRQLLWFGIGIGVMLLICFVDYINFQHWARYFYAVTLVLLAAVLFIGRAAKGSMRWIPLGPFDLQPSEVAKILMIIVLAKLLADRREVKPLPGPAGALLATMVPMVLIFLQPDLGTSWSLSCCFWGFFTWREPSGTTF